MVERNSPLPSNWPPEQVRVGSEEANEGSRNKSCIEDQKAKQLSAGALGQCDRSSRRLVNGPKKSTLRVGNVSLHIAKGDKSGRELNAWLRAQNDLPFSSD